MDRRAWPRALSGSALIAGVAGAPVRHSLSPLLHNAWIAAAGLDAAYVPFELAVDGFVRFAEGLRGASVRGLNVTIPFKEQALALADQADDAAREAGAANLLLFGPDGRIEARNTDGVGLLAAFATQAPHLRIDAAPAAVIGAGGAARGAVFALFRAGAPEIRIVNRSLPRALALAAAAPGPARAFALDQAGLALAGVGVIVNATSAGLDGRASLDLPLAAAPSGAVVMDMVYKPLRTDLLRRAAAAGHAVVDGLAMLIGQAAPSFEAFYGCPAPDGVDVRALALRALGETA